MADRDRIAVDLARRHYDLEPEIERIFHIRTNDDINPNEPIKLLEVNTATVSAGLMPITFGADPDNGISIPSTIIEVTPAEFGRIQNRDLPLPEGGFS